MSLCTVKPEKVTHKQCTSSGMRASLALDKRESLPLVMSSRLMKVSTGVVRIVEELAECQRSGNYITIRITFCLYYDKQYYDSIMIVL